MRDPYVVLGVSRNATDEEIKKAYRNLSRKYHPDANVNNPNKEHAEEMFKEVQQAYDAIMHQKQFGGSSYGNTGGYGTSGGYGQGGYYGNFGGFGGFSGTQGGYGSNAQGGSEQSVKLQAAANYIRNRYYKEALNVLEGMSSSERNGRWYYYSAVSHNGLGNNATALEMARKAVQHEPSNFEFRQFLEYMENGGNWYQSMGSDYQSPVAGMTKWCLSMLLLNLFCNLFCCGQGPYMTRF